MPEMRSVCSRLGRNALVRNGNALGRHGVPTTEKGLDSFRKC
jgi:hypothetical protein